MKFFVAGTDTDVGKTLITAALLQRANAEGMTALAMKPVAAGARKTPDGLRNDDAETLIRHASRVLPYEVVNPYCFEPPIAPHIAAHQTQTALEAGELAGHMRRFLDETAELHLIEGAGGWRVPLNGQETLADPVKQLHLPVILVVGLKLGCLNHAVLTKEAICRDGLTLAGWIGNQSKRPAMDFQEENLDYLRSAMDAPCLGVIPFIESDRPEQVAADYISLPNPAVH